MSRNELSAALRLTHAEMTSECRAVFFWMRASRNYRHLSDAGVWRAVQALLTRRVKAAAATKARAIRENWAGKDAAVRAEFDACDKAACWA